MAQFERPTNGAALTPACDASDRAGKTEEHSVNNPATSTSQLHAILAQVIPEDKDTTNDTFEPLTLAELEEVCERGYVGSTFRSQQLFAEEITLASRRNHSLDSATVEKQVVSLDHTDSLDIAIADTGRQPLLSNTASGLEITKAQQVPGDQRDEGARVNTPKTFHQFLDLPPELRDMVYEAIALDTTITIDKPSCSQGWPNILYASEPIFREVLPAVYRYASFEATVRNLNFDKVIKFVDACGPTHIKALDFNERLTIFLEGHEHYVRSMEQVQCGIEPWLAHIRTLATKEICHLWSYEPKQFYSYFEGLNAVQRENKTLRASGYYGLSELYTQLDNTPLENEIAKVVLRILLMSLWNFAKPDQAVTGEEES
ncbi:hypothetical protein LTR37_015808 [Vermiconidia calcicola]|uniref:Uncharacterized protein n=1 Tax=Vermiconidia calcicola TaxID=1690605 RepID=A0ACC3MPQ6_9PEZI|nr:hypothetical protein LTR37_015808 [Vermiconidia calcicola]